MTERQLKLLYNIKIERNLEIIGEAMNRLLKENPEFTIKNAVRVIGLGNQIIHGKISGGL